jgi:hypothetical protein
MDLAQLIRTDEVYELLSRYLWEIDLLPLLQTSRATRDAVRSSPHTWRIVDCSQSSIGRIQTFFTYAQGSEHLIQSVSLARTDANTAVGIMKWLASLPEVRRICLADLGLVYRISGIKHDAYANPISLLTHAKTHGMFPKLQYVTLFGLSDFYPGMDSLNAEKIVKELQNVGVETDLAFCESPECGDPYDGSKVLKRKKPNSCYACGKQTTICKYCKSSRMCNRCGVSWCERCFSPIKMDGFVRVCTICGESQAQRYSDASSNI